MIIIANNARVGGVTGAARRKTPRSASVPSISLRTDTIPAARARLCPQPGPQSRHFQLLILDPDAMLCSSTPTLPTPPISGPRAWHHLPTCRGMYAEWGARNSPSPPKG